MNRYQILIEYEGTLYNGWQIQKKGKSVQENIEIVLTKLLKEKIKIYGSGRTDTGVHAPESGIIEPELFFNYLSKEINNGVPIDLPITTKNIS